LQYQMSQWTETGPSLQGDYFLSTERKKQYRKLTVAERKRNADLHQGRNTGDDDDWPTGEGTDIWTDTVLGAGVRRRVSSLSVLSPFFDHFLSHWISTPFSPPTSSECPSFQTIFSPVKSPFLQLIPIFRRKPIRLIPTEMKTIDSAFNLPKGLLGLYKALSNS
jgi:hypothetical protein